MNILLFHGFTGSAYEIEPLAKYLNQHGYNVFVPELPGHPINITKFTAKNWLDFAAESVAKLPKDKPYILGGLSMGALISLIIYTKINPKYPKPMGLILLCPALFLRTSGRLATFFSKFGLQYFKHEYKKKNFDGPGQKTVPLKSLLEFDKIRKLALEALRFIKLPVFAAFAGLDKTIDTKKSLLKLVNTFEEPLDLFVLPKSAHSIGLDSKQELLFLRCKNFADRLI